VLLSLNYREADILAQPEMNNNNNLEVEEAEEEQAEQGEEIVSILYDSLIDSDVYSK
jgi:hypothetical protein